MPPRNSSRPSALSRVPLGLDQHRERSGNQHQHQVDLGNQHLRQVDSGNRHQRQVDLDSRHQVDSGNRHQVDLERRRDSLDSNQIRLGCNHLRPPRPTNQPNPSTKMKNVHAR
jgi:hypothetical protein